MKTFEIKLVPDVPARFAHWTHLFKSISVTVQNSRIERAVQRVQLVFPGYRIIRAEEVA